MAIEHILVSNLSC